MAASRRTAALRKAAKEPSASLSQATIRERILAYLQANRQAMDSAEGIARFWVREDTKLVERCLRRLHKAGTLAKHRIAGTDVYSLQPEAGPSPADQKNPGGEAAGDAGGESSAGGRGAR